jgi:hypothetical protein
VVLDLAHHAVTRNSFGDTPVAYLDGDYRCHQHHHDTPCRPSNRLRGRRCTSPVQKTPSTSTVSSSSTLRAYTDLTVTFAVYSGHYRDGRGQNTPEYARGVSSIASASAGCDGSRLDPIAIVITRYQFRIDRCQECLIEPYRE